MISRNKVAKKKAKQISSFGRKVLKTLPICGNWELQLLGIKELVCKHVVKQ